MYYACVLYGYQSVADLEKSREGGSQTRRWLLSRCLYKITLQRETISTEFSIKGGSTFVFCHSNSVTWSLLPSILPASLCAGFRTPRTSLYSTCKNLPNQKFKLIAALEADLYVFAITELYTLQLHCTHTHTHTHTLHTQLYMCTYSLRHPLTHSLICILSSSWPSRQRPH